MKTAVIFAGQGSQAVGMGQDFYENYDAFRRVFDYLSEKEKTRLGTDLLMYSQIQYIRSRSCLHTAWEYMDCYKMPV